MDFGLLEERIDCPGHSFNESRPPASPKSVLQVKPEEVDRGIEYELPSSGSPALSDVLVSFHSRIFILFEDLLID